MAGNLALSKDGHDIIIGRGATRVSGANQVAQLVKCRLLTLFGEWKQDTTLGLPWFDGILTKNVRVADIETALANVIRNTSGVRQLISLNIDANFRERSLNVTFVALSVYGNISDYVTWQRPNTE